MATRKFIYIFITFALLPFLSDSKADCVEKNKRHGVQFDLTRMESGDFFVAGGDLSVGGLSSVSILDSTTGKVKWTGDLLHPRFVHATVTLLNSKVLIIGGFNNKEGFLKTTELFDPKLKVFSNGPNLLAPRDNVVATLLKDGRVLVTGGDNDNANYLSSAEIYDQKRNIFLDAGKMNLPRAHHQQILLADGRVLILGGISFDYSLNRIKYLASAEIYDPKKNVFMYIGEMNFPRSRFSAVVLRNGKVLIMGGLISEKEPTKTAEIFDPVDNTFKKINDLIFSKAYGDAILLENGNVLSAGGYNYEGDPSKNISNQLTDIELYDVETGSFRLLENLSEPWSGGKLALTKNGDLLVIGGTKGNRNYRCDVSKLIMSQLTKK